MYPIANSMSCRFTRPLELFCCCALLFVHCNTYMRIVLRFDQKISASSHHIIHINSYALNLISEHWTLNTKTVNTHFFIWHLRICICECVSMWNWKHYTHTVITQLRLTLNKSISHLASPSYSVGSIFEYIISLFKLNTQLIHNLIRSTVVGGVCVCIHIQRIMNVYFRYRLGTDSTLFSKSKQPIPSIKLICFTHKIGQ